MIEKEPQIRTEILPELNTGSGLVPGQIDPSLTASEFMKPSGEFENDTYKVAWMNTPKKRKEIDAPSEDAVIVVYDDDKRELSLGVFDGVGGYEGGEKASKAAAEVLYDTAKRGLGEGYWKGYVTDVIGDMNDAVLAVNPETVEERPLTTAIVAFIKEQPDGSKKLFGAGIGHSLGFLVKSDGRVIQLNKEESQRQVLIERGVDVKTADKQGNVITNSLGQEDYELENVFEIDVEDGDIVLLTSDGITGDTSTQRLAGGASNEEVISIAMTDKRMTVTQRVQVLTDLSANRESTGKNDDKGIVAVEIKPFGNIEAASSQELTGENPDTTIPKNIGSTVLEDEVEITPASKLGLIDGKFIVDIGNGPEDDWYVLRSEIKDGVDKVLISGPHPTHTDMSMNKWYPLDKLLELNGLAVSPERDIDLPIESYNSNIITKVPRTAEDFVQLQQAKDELHDAELAKKISIYNTHIAELEIDLSESDINNLREFSRRTLMSKLYQSDNRGVEAQNEQQFAGQAMNKLSPQANEIASLYYGIYANRDKLQNL